MMAKVAEFTNGKSTADLKLIRWYDPYPVAHGRGNRISVTISSERILKGLSPFPEKKSVTGSVRDPPLLAMVS
jgi:hypothetical protein